MDGGVWHHVGAAAPRGGGALRPCLLPAAGTVAATAGGGFKKLRSSTMAGGSNEGCPGASACSREVVSSCVGGPTASCSAAGACTSEEDSSGGGGEPFFAHVGAQALGFYTPQAMLEALLHYRGADTGVVAEPPRLGSDNARRRKDALRPPIAAPPRRTTDGMLPPNLSLGAKALPVRSPLAEGVQDFSIGTLAGHLQDAILVGLGLMHGDLQSTKRKAVFVRPVFGGKGVFYSQGPDSFVVWASVTDSTGSVRCYCSCGGEDLKENVGARVRMGVSSTCSHAVAHVLALRAVALKLLCASVPDLLRRRPNLDASPSRPTDVHAEPAFVGKDGRSVHVVAYNRIMCVVVTPPTAAKQTRPVCRHVPCRTRNVLCVHSLAVKPSAAGYDGFYDEPGNEEDADAAARAAQDRGGANDVSGHAKRHDGDDGAAACDGGPHDDFDIHGEQEQPGPPPGTAPPATHGARNKKGAPRIFADTDRLRRARNMLPCRTEAAKCAHFDKIARGQTQPAGNDQKLFEEDCLDCGHAVGNLQAGKMATLHTLSGRVPVVTHAGVCSNADCGKTVPFDGSRLGLFSYSDKTVYTRTFLDIILFTIISTKSSISAASAASAFQLHCTGAIFDGDSAKSRQELGRATDEYSRTLIVPRNLYKCSKCYGCSETPYAAVVADGQTLGIFRDQSYPFERDTQNVPTIPISIDNACSVQSAKVRKCIRQRVKAGFGEEVAFSKVDQQAMSKFSANSGTMPEMGDHGDASHRKATAGWAAACFFNSFFQMSDVAADPSTPASPQTSKPPASQRHSSHPSTPASRLPPSSFHPPASADSPPRLEGGGPAVDSETVEVPHAHFKYCTTMRSVIGEADVLPIVRRERWAIVCSFFRTFLCEPVIGVFAGCSVQYLTALAHALVVGKLQREWMPLAECIESMHVVWPMLDMLADDMDADPEMCRAIGELLFFSLHTDLYMEDLWRGEMNADALLYEAEWKDTNSTKFGAWKRRQRRRPGRRPTGLVAVDASRHRASVQAEEVRSGIAFPDLDQVRPHPTDAAAAEAARACRAKAAANPKRSSKRKRADMEHGGLGDDDCRHAFLTHSTFTPGVVSYLCSCGILLGFEVLESAESPAGIVAALTAHFPRLPTTVYFDTACQAARNATRRVPWLVRLSNTAWALDRFHAPAHKCSPLFDANNYPERSGMHKTSAAENRHSLNKPLRNHLTYLGQDRFVVQMRLIGAINNLLILYRRSIGKSDVRHRPLPLFFHSLVASVCERVGCDCRHAQ